MLKTGCRFFCVPAVLLCSGCSFSSAIPVFGAAFPAWFFCALWAAILLLPTHLLIRRLGWQANFAPLVLSYAALMFIYAAAMWFLFFVR